MSAKAMLRERLPVPRLAVVGLGVVSLFCAVALTLDELPAAGVALVLAALVALAASKSALTRPGLVALSLPVHAFIAMCWTGVAEVNPCFEAGYADDFNEWTGVPPREACVVRADDGTTTVVAESWWLASTFACGVALTALLLAPGRWTVRATAAAGVCVATLVVQFG